MRRAIQLEIIIIHFCFSYEVDNRGQIHTFFFSQLDSFQFFSDWIVAFAESLFSETRPEQRPFRILFFMETVLFL